MYYLVNVFNVYYSILEVQDNGVTRSSIILMDLNDIIGKRSTFFTNRWKSTTANCDLQDYLFRTGGGRYYITPLKEKT